MRPRYPTHHGRREPFCHRHFGRATHPVPPPDPRPARPADRAGHPRRDLLSDGRSAAAPAPLADLGPGQGDGAAPSGHRGRRDGRLLLRRPLTVAARQQREHCECGGASSGVFGQADTGSKRRLSRILATFWVCLAFDLSLELPAPAWPTRLGLIRSLSARGRDPSQCCRQVTVIQARRRPRSPWMEGQPQ